MKSKLNKQQKKYIKACNSKELRKELKGIFKKLNKNEFKIKITPVVFEEGKFITNNPSTIQFLNNHPMFNSQISRAEFENINGKGVAWSETNSKEINEKFKETLESLTNPDLIDKRKEFHNAIDEHLEKEEIIKLSNSYNGPMEFCVKITNVNKDILQNIYNTFHKDKSGILDTNRFLHSNSLHTYCFSSNVASNDFKKIELVPTDEFLRYIGKEHLIEKPKTLEFDLPKTSHEKGKEVEEDALKKITELPIEDYYIENTNHLCWIYNRLILHNENPNYDYMIKLHEIALNYIENPYSEEDMFKCFQGARRMSKPLLFEFDSFASYLEYLQK
jgi:hypothetical protein